MNVSVNDARKYEHPGGIHHLSRGHPLAPVIQAHDHAVFYPHLAILDYGVFHHQAPFNQEIEMT